MGVLYFDGFSSSRHTISYTRMLVISTCSAFLVSDYAFDETQVAQVGKTPPDVPCPRTWAVDRSIPRDAG